MRKARKRALKLAFLFSVRRTPSASELRKVRKIHYEAVRRGDYHRHLRAS